MHNIHWLGLTSQYKQMLHLKAWERTENNEIWVLLKCQKEIQAILWAVVPMCRGRKEQHNVIIRLHCLSHMAANQHLRATFSLFTFMSLDVCTNGPICSTHIDQNTKSQMQSSALECRHTHAQTQTGTLVKVDDCSHYSVCFCADDQFRWADFQSRL